MSEELKSLFREAERRGDRETAEAILLKLEQESTAKPKVNDPLADMKPEEAPVLAQIGRGMMDVYQGGKQLAMNVFGGKEKAEAYNKELSEELALYNKNNPNFQFSRLVGSLATPVSLIPGGAGVSLTSKVATSAALGATASALTPVEGGNFWDEKLKQAGMGASIGAAVPVGGVALKKLGVWVDELTKPFYHRGVERDVGKFMNEFISENKPMIIKALNKAVAEGDDRTVGQIIADAASKQGDDFGGMIVRLEKDLAKESDAIKSIYTRQSSARRAVIDGIAGTEDDYAKALATRAANGEANYTKAFSIDVPADREIVKILDNKFGKKALREAMDIAKIDGAKSHTQVLHNVKLGLDRELKKSGDDALSEAQKRAVESVKGRLVGWLEKKNPSYGAARLQYAADSIPINRMEVGQELRDSLVNALGKDSPSAFASALRNAPRTIKRATGDPRFKSLDEILRPNEVADLNKIAKELVVESKAGSMAAASKSVSGQISGEVTLSLPHILSRPVVITNHILGILGKDMTPEYKKVLVEMVQNPDKFIKIYGGSSDNAKTKAAMDIVRRLGIISASQQSAIDVGNNNAP